LFSADDHKAIKYRVRLLGKALHKYTKEDAFSKGFENILKIFPVRGNI